MTEGAVERLEPYEHPELGAQMRPCQTLGGYVRFSEHEAALVKARKEGREEVRQASEEPLGIAAEDYEQAIGLISDLLLDAERVYEPGFEAPPHIAAARNLEDQREALRGLQAIADRFEEAALDSLTKGGTDGG